MRILIRRPHAYKFARDHKNSPIPGLILMNAKGKVLDSLRVPAGADRLVDLLED